MFISRYSSKSYYSRLYFKESIIWYFKYSDYIFDSLLWAAFLCLSQNSRENSVLKSDNIRSWGLWEIIRNGWGQKSAALLNKMSVFLRITIGLLFQLLALYHIWTQGKDCPSENSPGSHPDLRLPVCKIEQSNFLWIKPKYNCKVSSFLKNCMFI